MQDMPRPKLHDDTTRRALLDAAEKLIAEQGVDALSLRTVAAAAGASTQAVYSLFAGKPGLLAELATRTFAILSEGLDRLPVTDDPQADLVGVGLRVFRPYAATHPAMFRLSFQRISPTMPLTPEFQRERWESFARLELRHQRLSAAGLLVGRSPREAALQYNALLEGLASSALRGVLPKSRERQMWLSALTALVRGFAEPLI
jgi:AcrR family transcriptional regulator